MKRQLGSFEIESDSLVALHFSDGHTIRASIRAVAGLVNNHDYRLIKRSLEVRSSYLRRSLPPWAKVIAISIAAIAIGVGSVKAAGFISTHYWRPSHINSTQNPATNLSTEAMRGTIKVPSANSVTLPISPEKTTPTHYDQKPTKAAAAQTKSWFNQLPVHKPLKQVKNLLGL